MKPTILYEEARSIPSGNVVTRALQAVFVEHRIPYTAKTAIDRLLPRIGFPDCTVEAGGYRVTRPRIGSAQDVIDAVLTHEEYFKFHPGFRPTAGQTVIDIGAHIGTFTLAAAKYTGPSGRIIAIEPFPLHFGYLRRNIEQNSLRCVKVVNGAIAGQHGSITLFLDRRGGLTEVDYGCGTMTVDAYTIAEIMEEHGIDTCDLLKIDCEGAEFDFLPHLDHSVWKRIKRIAMEYTVPIAGWSRSNPDHVALKRSRAGELVGLIRQNGFRIDGYYDSDGARCGYVFATREG